MCALPSYTVHVGILDRNDAIEHLDHRNFGAHIVVEARKFDPDRARSDHQQLFRHFGRGHRMAIGPDALAVGGRKGQVARARAGRDDDMLGRERFGPLLALDLELARAGWPAIAHMPRDLVLIPQVGYALLALFHVPPRPLANPGPPRT